MELTSAIIHMVGSVKEVLNINFYWLYNGGPYQLIVCHFFIGICAYMGREWERLKIGVTLLYFIIIIFITIERVWTD